MGCCFGREQNEGSLEFSKTKKDDILLQLTNKADMKNSFNNGWRLHHQYEANRSFLSHAIQSGNVEVLKSVYLTVSQESLLEVVNQRPNYEFIFSDWALVDQLARNYETTGFIVNNEAILKSFLAHEAVHNADQVKRQPFQLLRDAFSVTCTPLKVEATPTPNATTPVVVATPTATTPVVEAPVEVVTPPVEVVTPPVEVVTPPVEVAVEA